MGMGMGNMMGMMGGNMMGGGMGMGNMGNMSMGNMGGNMGGMGMGYNNNMAGGMGRPAPPTAPRGPAAMRGQPPNANGGEGDRGPGAHRNSNLGNARARPY